MSSAMRLTEPLTAAAPALSSRSRPRRETRLGRVACRRQLRPRQLRPPQMRPHQVWLQLARRRPHRRAGMQGRRSRWSSTSVRLWSRGIHSRSRSSSGHSRAAGTARSAGGSSKARGRMKFSVYCVLMAPMSSAMRLAALRPRLRQSAPGQIRANLARRLKLKGTGTLNIKKAGISLGKNMASIILTTLWTIT